MFYVYTRKHFIKAIKLNGISSPGGFNSLWSLPLFLRFILLLYPDVSINTIYYNAVSFIGCLIWLSFLTKMENDVEIGYSMKGDYSKYVPYLSIYRK